MANEGDGRPRTQAPPAGGRGRMGGALAGGPGGNCVCPQCGASSAHARGVPCDSRRCSKCGTTMTRTSD